MNAETKDIIEIYLEGKKQQPENDLFTVEIVDADNKIGENLIAILTTKKGGNAIIEHLAKMQAIEVEGKNSSSRKGKNDE